MVREWNVRRSAAIGAVVLLALHAAADLVNGRSSMLAEGAAWTSTAAAGAINFALVARVWNWWLRRTWRRMFGPNAKWPAAE